jgi:hypothetical protein
MSILTSSSQSALLTNILQETIFTASEISIAGNLVTVYDMIGTPGLTSQVAVYPTISASALTESSDLTAQTNVNPATITITASEIGVRADLTDLMAESSASNQAADIGRILGQAVGNKLDQDVFAQFDSLTTSVINTASALTPNDILKALFLLRAQSAPTDNDGDYFGVFSPAQLHNVTKVLTQAGFVGSVAPAISGLGNNLLSTNAYLGKIFNCKIFMSTNVVVDSATQAVGGVFSPRAFGHVLKRPIVVREQRDESARSTEFICTTARGNAILKDIYGVKVKTAAAIS